MAETYTREIAGQTVSCTADPALEPQVDALLNVIEAAPAELVKDGFVLRAGWSAFKLVDDGGILIVHCPDFAGDIHDWVSNVTLALAVEAEQSVVARLAELEDASPALFTQRVVYADGALESHALVAQHAAAGSDRDSGWFLGFPGEDAEEDALKATTVGQLVRSRAAVLKVFVLPEGYLAAFDGDEIELILDADDETVYERPHEEAQA